MTPLWFLAGHFLYGYVAGAGRNQLPDPLLKSFVLAADDLHAARTKRIEGVGQGWATYQSEFTYDRHEGIPVLRSMHVTTQRPDGSRGTVDLKVVERRFGSIPEEEFDPDLFLDGPPGDRDRGRSLRRSTLDARTPRLAAVRDPGALPGGRRGDLDRDTAGPR